MYSDYICVALAMVLLLGPDETERVLINREVRKSNEI